jgi:hypothetical protein
LLQIWWGAGWKLPDGSFYTKNKLFCSKSGLGLAGGFQMVRFILKIIFFASNLVGGWLEASR